MHTGFWLGNLRERCHLEDPGVDGKLILKWVFKKWDGAHGLDYSGSEWGQVAGCCECGNELPYFVSCGKSL